MKNVWDVLRLKLIDWLSHWGDPETRDFRYMLWFFYLVILQVLSVNVFEQMPLAELVAKTESQNQVSDLRNQLVFNIF